MTRSLSVLRRSRLLTQRGLADRAGVSHVTVATIETGRRTPALATIRKLAGALAVEPTEVREFAAAICGGEEG